MNRPESFPEPGAWDQLVEAYLDGELDEDGVAKLADQLRASPESRQSFWRIARSVLLLEQWAGEEAGVRAALAHDAELRADRSAWSQTRSSPWPFAPRLRRSAAMLAAVLAAGIAIGTGIAFAVVPLAWRGQPIGLELVNPGFETNAGLSLAADGTQTHAVPPDYGVWAGDPVRIATAEHGISPAQGTRMLVFERAAPAPGEPGDARATACDLYQIVDLSPYQAEIAKGTSLLELSARFFNDHMDRDKPVDFFVRLSVFNKSPEEVLAGWPKTRYDDVAAQSNWVRQSRSPQKPGWQPCVARVVLPTECRFALVHLSTGEGYAADRQAVFGRHYCDDVRLTLTPSAVPAD